MTDRHSGYVVTLADDIRDDDAEAVINALRMVKGVLTVEPIIGGGVSAAFVHEQRVRSEFREKLFNLVREI
jgi:hypothetical protein